jgi:hypothetical protein
LHGQNGAGSNLPGEMIELRRDVGLPVSGSAPEFSAVDTVL